MSSDQHLLDALLRDAMPTIEALVTGALRQGHPLAEIGILLERRFDGTVNGGAGPRDQIARRFGSDPRLDEENRRAVMETFEGASADQIPAVLVVHCEGYVAVGALRLSGAFAAES